jgi:uncharacterized Zn-finger protein
MFAKHDPDFFETHSAPPSRTCSHCGLGFSSTYNLNAHIRVLHDGDKQFICGECGKGFGHKHVLQRHVETVHGSPPLFTPEKQRLKKPGLDTFDDTKLPKLQRVITVTVGPHDLA